MSNFKKLFASLLLISGLLNAGSSSASVLLPAFGLANDQYAKPKQPYAVNTAAVTSDCRGLVGIIAKIATIRANLQCDNAFPYGFSSPVSTALYYPKNISKLEKVPAVVFVGGITSNPGQYADLLKLWASYGFVVFAAGDFINSNPSMHLLGLYNLSKLNADPKSDLFGKIDLSKVVIAGHSAGGQATLQTASLPTDVFHLIDKNINIVGALPIEPGPLALGALVKVQTLMLTGAADVVVSPILWTNIWELPEIKKVPAWGATAKNAGHLSPLMPASKNEFAGITTAWLLYAGKNDPGAKEYFVGNNFKLSKDNQFIQGGLFGSLAGLKASRNQAAADLK